jgi:peptidoglycan/LPS O-acetylase OafA/YrhL
MHNAQRVFGLDVLRAIAILLVLKGHAKLLAGDIFKNWVSIPLIDGVELFFVLSGFFIGGQILKSMQTSSDAWSWNDTLFFLKRRWYRTLPNYYFILLIQLGIVWLGFSRDAFSSFHWNFLVFSQNLIHGFQGFFWESWSLSVEEWFYFIFPFLLLMLNIFFSKKQSYLIAALFLLLLPLASRILKPFPAGMDWYHWDVEWRKVILYRLDSIAFGLMAAYFFFYHQRLFSRYARLFFIVGIVLLVVDHFYMLDASGSYERVVSFTIKSLGVALLLPLLNSWKAAPLNLFGSAMVWISKRSYSMYLVNLGVVFSLLNHFMMSNDFSIAIIRYGLFWVITFVLAHLLYVHIEMPWMMKREKKST